MSQTFTSDIVHLNVGGTRFSTSRQTLTCIQDSFFTSMLSGRIPTCRDETGALFIDRDPKLFSIILNFLRTRELDLSGVDPSVLRHEAEFYGVTPLAKRLMLCEDLERSMCGDVLFTGFIASPSNPPISLQTSNLQTPIINNGNSQQQQQQMITINNKSINSKPGNVMRLTPHSASQVTTSSHSRNSSMDFMTVNKTHSRKSSYEIVSTSNNTLSFAPTIHHPSHSRNQSFDLKQIKSDLGILLGSNQNTASSNTHLNQQQQQQRDLNIQVNIIVGHLNWIAVAYNHFVCCYKMKDGMGWQLMFQSPYIEEDIDRIAINSKHQSNVVQQTMQQSSPNSSLQHQQQQSGNFNNLTGLITHGNQQQQLSGIVGSLSAAAATATTQPDIPGGKMCTVLAVAFETSIRLWMINDENINHQIGTFSLGASIDHLFFIGSQLVSLKFTGKIGVWNSLTQLWQIQDVTPISSYDTAGSFLLLGGQNGIIYYIDMQKFPLRIKDNDLLVTELYKDASGDAITALSVYLTPKTTNTGNWIEIAYGTSSGNVRVVVQHPETVGHGPQLFQTFNVHRSSVIKVMLTEKYLVSVCSEFNHVRTWTVTRFRGMISTQPGSTPLASFKIVSIDALDSPNSYLIGNDIGPYGEREDQQVFIQKVVPFTDQLFVRLSSTGKRICTIKSVDYSPITCFCVHECEGPSRLNSRPRRYLFTGHSNGTIQMWDLTTALELKPSDQTCLGGPTASEFVRLLDQCDLATSTNSGYSTPNTYNCLSPCPSICQFNPRILTKSLLTSNNHHNIQLTQQQSTTSSESSNETYATGNNKSTISNCNSQIQNI